MYLIGEPVELTQSNLAKRLGRKVEYILKIDLKERVGEYVYPRDGEITEVKNHKIEFDYNREKISIVDIVEMVFAD